MYDVVALLAEALTVHGYADTFATYVVEDLLNQP